MLVYPKVLGETMDHLIAKDYYYMYYLLLTFAGMMFFGYVSRIYDTRVFSKIYRKFASVETNKQYENDVDVTVVYEVAILPKYYSITINGSNFLT